MRLDLTSFAIKWQQTQLTEKSAYQQHFRDLCEALGVSHPTEDDVVGNSYTFEKHVTKVGGGSGFADVWKRDAFAWEYKLPGGDLKKAYKQLNEYHEDLENPPLLIVCDFKRFEVHTKFDSQRTRVYAFNLEELRVNKPVPTSALLPQDVLKYVFGDRNMLRPEAVTERVTRDADTDLLKLAQQLELERAATPTPHTKQEIAHFLIRIVFCLFADSIGLIPNNVFRSLVESSRSSRINFNKKLPFLFEAMSQEGTYPVLSPPRLILRLSTLSPTPPANSCASATLGSTRPTLQTTTSRPAHSPSFTTLPESGWPMLTALSTKPSSMPTAGLLISPTRQSSHGYSPSTTSVHLDLKQKAKRNHFWVPQSRLRRAGRHQVAVRGGCPVRCAVSPCTAESERRDRTPLRSARPMLHRIGAEVDPESRHKRSLQGEQRLFAGSGKRAHAKLQKALLNPSQAALEHRGHARHSR